MSAADVDAWRQQFQIADAAELDGGEIPSPASRVAGLATVCSRPLVLMYRELTRLL